MDKTLSKPKLQTINSQTVKKTQDKRTEDNEKIYVSKCGAPHIKFGIYRGKGSRKNAVSSIDFDKISVEKRIN